MTDLGLGQPANTFVVGTEQNFEQEILVRSNECPVLVDFWAQWCEPCRHLAPMLERLVNETEGRIRLVKVDVETQARLAQSFGVQSIPAVFLVRNGQIADHFTGVQPEGALREWLRQFLPSPAEQLAAAAEKLEQTDPQEAEVKYRAAIDLDPRADTYKIGLARLLLNQYRNSDSRLIIEQLEQRGFLEPAAASIKAELDLRSAAADSGGISDCRREMAEHPEDAARILRLAEALGAAQQFEEALELCLRVIGEAQGEHREHARLSMLRMFQLLGPGAELARSYRRRLATLLY